MQNISYEYSFSAHTNAPNHRARTVARAADDDAAGRRRAVSTVRGVHRARSRARECGSRGARREAPPSPWVGRLRAGTLFDARAARAVARRRDDVSRPFSISYSRSARRSRSAPGELDGDSRASSTGTLARARRRACASSSSRRRRPHRPAWGRRRRRTAWKR